MKSKSALGMIAVSALSLASVSAHAGFLNNWTFDITGSGSTSGDGVTHVNEFLDILGTSYIDLDLSNNLGGSTFNFQDVGTFEVAGADGVSANFDKQIGNFPNIQNIYESTFIFKTSGTVQLNGNINFAAYAVGDYFEWWVGDGISNTVDYGTVTAGATYGANNGVKIGTFQLNNGTGNVNASGIPNGQITITLQPIFLASGYFKDSSGTDLSTFVNATLGDGPLFGFVTTNASLNRAVSAAVNTEIVQELAGDPSLALNSDGLTYASDPPNRFVVGNNGQYRWTTVPEPGSLALLGIGLLGLSARFRTRKTS